MKICPVCDRPAEDLVGQDDVLMCPRCAAAVEVEPSLRYLDAEAWKDSGPPEEEDRRFGLPGGPWGAGLAALVAVSLLAVIVFALVSSGRRVPLSVPSPLPVPVADGAGGETPPVGNPAPVEAPDAWRPPGGESSTGPSGTRPSAPRGGGGRSAEEEAEDAPPSSLSSQRPRGREMAQEAAKRLSALSAPFGRGPGDVRKSVEEAAEVDRLLAGAAALAPDLPDLAFSRGKLRALQGRLDEAYAAYESVLAADEGRLEALMAQGWILTTLHFVAEAEKAAYPRTAEAFRKKITDRYGSPLPAPRARPEADRLRGAFQHIARGEFEAGRSELEGMSGGPGPAWLMSEIAVLGASWGDLGPSTGRGPPSPPPRRGMPGAREEGPFDSDHRLCRKLSFFIARQRGRRPFSPAMPQTVTPNAIALRIDAALLSEAGRPQEALEKLDLALAASPEDLFARLDRAGALKRLGRNEASGREYDAASKMAADLGFPRAVTDEITDRRPGPR